MILCELSLDRGESGPNLLLDWLLSILSEELLKNVTVVLVNPAYFS